MKKTSLVTIIALMMVGLSFADVPATINFQGALKDENGEPVNDTKIIQFLIYDDETAGSLVWSEYQSSVEIVDGIFSVELGSDTAFPSDLFQDEELYITFQLGGDEMSPRQRILSVPYAVISEQSVYADSAGCSYYAVSAIVADSANYAYSLEGAHLGDLVQQDELGNVNITGDLTAVGDVTATAFYGDGSNLTGITGIYDETYVHAAGPDTISSAAPIGTFHVINTDNYGPGIDIHDAGIGIYIQDTEHRGVKVDSTGNDGFYVESVGSPSTTQSNPLNNGFEVAGAEGNGVFIGQADEDGVHINTTIDDGIHIEYAGDYGILVESTVDDGICVNSTGGYGMYIINSADHGYVLHNAAGHGLWISNASSQGVRINNAGQDGVRVCEAGSPSTYTESSDYNGFEIAGTEGNGLYVGQADDDGIYIYHAGNPTSETSTVISNGIEVAGTEGYCLYVGYSDLSGIRINSTQGHGLYVVSAVMDGINVEGDDDGVEATTNATSGEWGVYTENDIQCRNLTETEGTRTYGKNTDSSFLEEGDIVCLSGGFNENVLGEDSFAVVNVSKANKNNSESVFGVVAYKVNIREDIQEMEDGKIEVEKSFRYTGGKVNPGDYLSIIVFGQADVRVAKNSNIKAGKKITVSETDGKAREIQRTDDLWTTGILGKALEDSNGKDKIKVYVNCK